MIIGFMRDMHLTSTKDIFLLDCQVTGLKLRGRRVCREVLSSFIRFTGDISVKELTPEHVRMYITYLADHPSKGGQSVRSLAKQYAVIRAWIRWLFAQKAIAERFSNRVKPPPLKSLFPLQLEMA